MHFPTLRVMWSAAGRLLMRSIESCSPVAGVADRALHDSAGNLIRLSELCGNHWGYNNVPVVTLPFWAIFLPFTLWEISLFFLRSSQHRHIYTLHVLEFRAKLQRRILCGLCTDGCSSHVCAVYGSFWVSLVLPQTSRPFKWKGKAALLSFVWYHRKARRLLLTFIRTVVLFGALLISSDFQLIWKQLSSNSVFYHYFSVLKSLAPFNKSVYNWRSCQLQHLCFINPATQAGGFTNRPVPFQVAASQ